MILCLADGLSVSLHGPCLILRKIATHVRNLVRYGFRSSFVNFGCAGRGVTLEAFRCVRG